MRTNFASAVIVGDTKYYADHIFIDPGTDFIRVDYEYEKYAEYAITKRHFLYLVRGCNYLPLFRHFSFTKNVQSNRMYFWSYKLSPDRFFISTNEHNKYVVIADGYYNIYTHYTFMKFSMYKSRTPRVSYGKKFKWNNGNDYIHFINCG